MPPVISIVGKSNSGKTTLVEKLIPELKQRGYRIGTIKHAYHDFDLDREKKDSWRHQEAGADTVIVSSRTRIAMVKSTGFEDIDSLMPYFADRDLVITEGYKRENKPKIEVFRKTAHELPLCMDNSNLIAMVTDAPDIQCQDVPKFGLEEIKKIADFIEDRFLADKPANP